MVIPVAVTIFSIYALSVHWRKYKSNLKRIVIARGAGARMDTRTMWRASNHTEVEILLSCTALHMIWCSHIWEHQIILSRWKHFFLLCISICVRLLSFSKNHIFWLNVIVKMTKDKRQASVFGLSNRQMTFPSGSQGHWATRPSLILINHHCWNNLTIPFITWGEEHLALVLTPVNLLL